MADEDFDLLNLGSFLEEPTIVDDVPPPESAPEEGTNPPPDESGLRCVECGNPVVWSGRGRKPRYCPEHKTRTAGAKKATTRVASTVKAREELISDLTREMATFGVGLSKVLPTTGVTTFKRAERTATALVKVAGDNARLLASLEMVAKAASVIDLGEAGLAIGVALLVDTGRVNPDAAMPMMLGVSETWHELNDDSSTNEARVDRATDARLTADSVFEVPVPSRFEKVT